MKYETEACTAALCGCERDQDDVPYWDCPECGGTAIVRCGCAECRPSAHSCIELAEAEEREERIARILTCEETW
mgnify:FL=1